jgi:hypothetical protein
MRSHATLNFRIGGDYVTAKNIYIGAEGFLKWN